MKVKYNRPQVLINTGVTPKDRKKGKVKNAKIYNLSKKKNKKQNKNNTNLLWNNFWYTKGTKTAKNSPYYMKKWFQFKRWSSTLLKGGVYLLDAFKAVLFVACSK